MKKATSAPSPTLSEDSLKALDAIIDEKLRASALELHASIMTAVSGALAEVQRLKDDPEAYAEFVREIQLART